MSYTQEQNQTSDFNGPFRGFITGLLQDTLFDEEGFGPLESDTNEKKDFDQKYKLIQKYTSSRYF